MDLKLNVYKKEHGKKVVDKTYVADTYDIMLGTVEDLISLIDAELFSDSVSGKDFVVGISKFIIGSFSQFKPIMKDIFDGLTDEELRRVSMKEATGVLIDVAKYSFAEINNASSSKNV